MPISFIILYRVSQEERSIFWEVIASVILSKIAYMYMCRIPNSFQDRAVSLYSFKIVDKKRYYVLFLIPVFIVQVTKLVQFSQYIYIYIYIYKKKLRGLSPQVNYTDRATAAVGEVMPTFA
jgi:hypothetical protein